MADDTLEHAVNLIKSGDIDEGGKILVGLLKENQQIERAWAWLYMCMKTDEQRIICLNKVLELNPNHERAKAALEKLIGRQTLQLSIQSEATEILSQNIAMQTTEQGQESKPIAKEDDVQDSRPNKFKVVFVKPKIIFNKPDENSYAKTRNMLVNFPDGDAAMLGTRLMLGGISITPHDYPRCIEAGRILHKSQCYICEFFSISDCPIRRDISILQEAKALFAQNKRYWQEDRDQRDAKIDAIYSELKAHGRPLHYEVIAQIMKDRYPKLRLNANMVLHFMMRHTEKFEWGDMGVYKAK